MKKQENTSLTEYKRQQLKQLFPEVFTEGDKIDFDKLRLTLGESIEADAERFGLYWAGKNDCFKVIQKPPVTRLTAVPDEGINADKTKHSFIEGDNAEVLKLLQKTHTERVKMIYIDPPYNTGREFIYSDKFKESKENFAAYTQKITKQAHKYSAAAAAAGRLHSGWLDMMYPRLFLARLLLKEDGVIFISIDENEFDNLKKICNEIFGEENFRNVFITRRHDKNLNRQFIEKGLKTFNVGFEYILCYAKSDAFRFAPVYKEADKKRRENGYWKGFWNDADRPTMRYDLLGVTPAAGQWKRSEARAREAVENYHIYLADFAEKMTLEEYWKATGKTKNFIRRNPKGRGKNQGVDSWIPPAEGKLRTTDWTDLLTSKAHSGTKGLFSHPKNPEVLKLLLQAVIQEKDEIVLDFFAGSCSTAQAVLEDNADRALQTQFIMVQLPEAVAEKSAAYKLGLKNIAEIGKERMRQVIQKIKTESEDAQLDLGFRVYRATAIEE